MPPKKKSPIPGYDRVHKADIRKRQKEEKKALSYITKKSGGKRGRGRK